MKIYTRTGDDGTTSLSGGRRIPKYNDRVEAYGSVDELIAWCGLLRDHPDNKSRQELLIYIQDQLMRCAAAIAADPGNHTIRKILPENDSVTRLESEIDLMEQELKKLSSFILPGGHILVSYCHIARCVCRRAERQVIKLENENAAPDIVLKLLNRLSDYLFVLSRKICLELDIEEIKWKV